MNLKSNIYHKDPRYKPIQRLFEKLFFEYNYSLGQKFDSNIWFLLENRICEEESIEKTNDEEKSNIRKNIENKMNILIQSIANPNKSLKKSSSKSIFDFSPAKKCRSKSFIEGKTTDFSIYVCDFIKTVSEVLIQSQNEIVKCDEILKTSDGYQIKSNLEKALNEIKLKEEELDQKINDNKYDTLLHDKLYNEKKLILKQKSYLNLNLSRICNFPEGDYAFKIKLKEINNEKNIIEYEKKTKSSKKIKILTSNQKINLFQMNLNQNDVSFDSVYTYSLNQKDLLDYMRYKELQIKTIMLKKGDDSSVFVNQTKNSRKDIRGFTIKEPKRRMTNVNPAEIKKLGFGSLKTNQIEQSNLRSANKVHNY
jgi:hypothetical protein